MDLADAALAIAAFLLVMLAVLVVFKPSKSAVFLAAIIVTPFFLKVTSSSVEFGDTLVARDSGQTFPISLPAVLLFSGLTLLKKARGGLTVRSSSLNLQVLAFIASNAVSYAVGLFSEVHLYSFLFFIQTVVPLIAFFIALNCLDTPETLLNVFVWSVAVLGGVMALLILYSFVGNGIAATVMEGLSSQLWIFPMYGLFDYIPLVVAVAYGMTLALLLGGVTVRHRSLLAIAVMVLLCSLLFLRSRGALISAVGLSFIELLFFSRYVSKIKSMTVIAVLAGTIFLGLVLGPETLTLRQFRDFADLGTDEQSLDTRMFNWSKGIRDISENPFGGLRFLARAEDQDAGDRIRIANSHNQYLTYGVRAGIFPMIIFIWILFSVHGKLLRLCKRSPTSLIQVLAIGLFGILLSVCLISNMLQDNFTQPYPGILMWFAVGAGEFLHIYSSRLSRLEPPGGGGGTLGVKEGF